MIASFLRQMVEGLVSPRASARRVLAADLGLDAAFLFLVLAYALQAILQILLPGVRELPEGMESIPLGVHMVNLFVQIAIVGIFAALLHGLGKLFGGTGSRRQAFVIMAWHTLVTVLLTPLFLYGFTTIEDREIPVGTMFLMLACAIVWLWVLAAYAAELHGFRSIWNVFGVIFGMSFLMSAFVVNVLSAA